MNDTIECDHELIWLILLHRRYFMIGRPSMEKSIIDKILIMQKIAIFILEPFAPINSNAFQSMLLSTQNDAKAWANQYFFTLFILITIFRVYWIFCSNVSASKHAIWNYHKYMRSLPVAFGADGRKKKISIIESKERHSILQHNDCQDWLFTFLHRQQHHFLQHCFNINGKMKLAVR